MTQTQDIPTVASPTRRAGLPSAPVLIRVPAVALAPTSASTTARPIRARVQAPRPVARRRRRLRREVRIAAYLLLALLPASGALMAFRGGAFGSSFDSPAPPTLVIPNDGASEAGPGPAPISISISLEPIQPPQPRDLAESPIFLSGQLLPADPPEGVSHGGN